MDAQTVIAQQRAEFVSAFNREDVAGLCGICTHDVIRFPPNQPPLVRTASSSDFWHVGFTSSRSRMEVTPRELYLADGWAFDWFDWTIFMVPLAGGAPVLDQGSSFWQWRYEHDGVWRVARAMWNSSNETPSVWAGGWADFPDGFQTLMAPMG